MPRQFSFVASSTAIEYVVEATVY